MHGKVLMGSEKPTNIVAMLRHFFRVTSVKEGCGVWTTSGLQALQASATELMNRIKLYIAVIVFHLKCLNMLFWNNGLFVIHSEFVFSQPVLNAHREIHFILSYLIYASLAIYLFKLHYGDIYLTCWHRDKTLKGSADG